jgi:predicted DsbA family dithiol-disulfide isomerase
MPQTQKKAQVQALQIDIISDIMCPWCIVGYKRLQQALSKFPELDKQTQLKLALFQAYFTEQKNPQDIEVLVDIATQVGLEANEARAVLQEGRFALEVKQSEQLWISRGIQAVPTLIFNQQSLLSGAQPSAVIEQLIAKLIAKLKQKTIAAQRHCD